MKHSGEPMFLYTYACHEEEADLCHLELRTLLGAEPERGWLFSAKEMDASRSPFVKWRIDIRLAAGDLETLADKASQLLLDGRTFKVMFIETDGTVDYDARRQAERVVGAGIRGRAEMREPQLRFGLAKAGDRWVLGECHKQEAVWLKHNAKPQPYSTALGTRVARAVANLAVPAPVGVRAIDPCCGIGTVVLEALSMDIDMVGGDVNPLAVRGARVNLAHFGYPDVIALRDIRQAEGHFDAAVMDLPYNLCSKLSAAERLDMLCHARRLAARVVIVSTEPVEEDVVQAGLAVLDRCEVRKGSFVRTVLVCSRLSDEFSRD